MSTKRRPAVAAEHWNLTQEQQAAAARLTRDDVELLTIATELGGLEIGELGPRFVRRLVDALRKTPFEFFGCTKAAPGPVTRFP